MAEIVCGVVQPTYSGCCDGPVGNTLPPTVVVGPPGPPGPEGPQGPPGTSCPLFCGTGSPEGVVTSPIGGIYEQTDAALTTHSGWWKRSGTGNTGWRRWVGLGGAGVGSLAIGDNAAATGVDSIAFGENTTASGARSEAFGKSSSATADDAKAFGAGAVASAVGAIAVGLDSLSAVAGGLAAGRLAKVNAGATSGIALGDGASIVANSVDSIVIGNTQLANYGIISIGQRHALTSPAPVNFNTTYGSIYVGFDIEHLSGHHTGGCIAIGNQVHIGTGTFTNQIAIGDSSWADGHENTLLGAYAISNPANAPVAGLAAGTYGVGIGLQVSLNGDCVVAVGHDSLTRGDFCTALGPHARAGNDQTTNSCNAVGRFATALGHRSQAFGVNSTVSAGHTASIALGYNALTTAAAQLMVGDDAVDARILAVHFNGSASAAIQTDSSGRATFIGTLAQPTSTHTLGTLLNTTHGTVRVDTGVGSLVFDLPAAASVSGRIYTIIKVSADANTVTIDANAAETINGNATVVLTTQYEKVVIQSNGVSWDIIG